MSTNHFISFSSNGLVWSFQYISFFAGNIAILQHHKQTSSQLLFYIYYSVIDNYLIAVLMCNEILLWRTNCKNYFGAIPLHNNKTIERFQEKLFNQNHYSTNCFLNAPILMLAIFVFLLFYSSPWSCLELILSLITKKKCFQFLL